VIQIGYGGNGPLSPRFLLWRPRVITEFSSGVTDVEWITLDKEGGWAVLTKDLRITTRPHERQALDRSHMVYFFLTGRLALPRLAPNRLRCTVGLTWCR
jgi:hypothetical protein